MLKNFKNTPEARAAQLAAQKAAQEAAADPGAALLKQAADMEAKKVSDDAAAAKAQAEPKPPPAIKQPGPNYRKYGKGPRKRPR